VRRNEGGGGEKGGREKITSIQLTPGSIYYNTSGERKEGKKGEEKGKKRKKEEGGACEENGRAL